MKKTLLFASATIATVVAIVVVVIVRSHSARASRDADKALQARPIPVAVAVAEISDVPVFADGLGSVLPLYTVTVKTLVDGRLDTVAYKEGQFLKKGDPIAQIDPRPFQVQLAQATATRAKDEASHHGAVLTARRDSELLRTGLQTQQQVDNDNAQVDSIAALVKQDEATMSAAALQIDYAHIVSPIDGVAGIRLVDPGNIVHPADATGLVVITQLDPIAVVLTLPEDDLPRISASRLKGVPHVIALSRDGVTKLGEGELTVVDNQINVQTATLKIKATMANPEAKLWPNQFVKARLLLDVKKGVLVVPSTALQRSPKGSIVYVVDATDHANTRDVVADEIEGDRAIVTSGLSAGDRVVTDGQAQLKPGAKVSVQGAKISRAQ